MIGIAALVEFGAVVVDVVVGGGTVSTDGQPLELEALLDIRPAEELS